VIAGIANESTIVVPAASEHKQILQVVANGAVVAGCDVAYNARIRQPGPLARHSRDV